MNAEVRREPKRFRATVCGCQAIRQLISVHMRLGGQNTRSRERTAARD